VPHVPFPASASVASTSIRRGRSNGSGVQVVSAQRFGSLDLTASVGIRWPSSFARGPLSGRVCGSRWFAAELEQVGRHRLLLASSDSGFPRVVVPPENLRVAAAPVKVEAIPVRPRCFLVRRAAYIAGRTCLACPCASA
jgi:hypothetical protein